MSDMYSIYIVSDIECITYTVCTCLISALFLEASCSWDSLVFCSSCLK